MATKKNKPALEKLLKRDHTLYGGVLFGLDGYVIELQARAVEIFKEPVSWRSAVKITGMPNGAVYEALDRITGAFAKYNIPNPEVKIVVNLAPADLLKEGTWLDLPIAIIIAQAAGVLPDLHESHEGDFILLGEIGLHGDIRRVPGVLSMAYISKPGQSLIVPAGNEKECALIMATPGHEGCKIAPVSSLKEVMDYFAGKSKLQNILGQGVSFESAPSQFVDMGRIKGQEKAKQAALIAAAGGHNLLLSGPPGEGKSLLASSIPGILPRLSDHEKVELTRIYSAYGALDKDGMVINTRPMRAIHHTASRQALVGGGSVVPRPGEITLSHLGVLFLDELAEFNQSVLDSLRQPLENGKVSISRVGGTLEYPCRFTLVAAMNPCPCGYYGDDRCRCSDKEIQKYQNKISGPILDRIDLQVDMTPLTTEERFTAENTSFTKEYRKRVEIARSRQDERFKDTGIPFNAAIPGGHIMDFCQFGSEGLGLYRQTVDSYRLSTRSIDRLAKVARTVADLYNSDDIQPTHVKTAESFVLGGNLKAAFL